MERQAGTQGDIETDTDKQTYRYIYRETKGQTGRETNI